MQIKTTSNEKKPIQIRLIAHKKLPKKNSTHFFHMEKMGGVKLKSNLGMANNVQYIHLIFFLYIIIILATYFFTNENPNTSHNKTNCFWHNLLKLHRFHLQSTHSS
jgi:uncharacterized membrane protein